MFRKIYTGVFVTPEDLQKVNEWLRDAVSRSYPRSKKETMRVQNGLPMPDPAQRPPVAMQRAIERIHRLAVSKYKLPKREKIIYGVEPTGEFIYLLPDSELGKHFAN